ncbi:hypothetical protein QOZ80_1BG0048530 [Eleusine coracana subsp. coracana]|nr:hypothetical protein QOZ80_1BG0048530 [Eleusine coracana subsp. coracana]
MASSSSQGDQEQQSSEWVILGSIPRVLLPLPQSSEGQQEAFSLALMAPPRVSRLTVSGTSVFPKTPTPRHFPFVLAADPSGLLLLSAILPRPAPVKVFVDRGPGNNSFHWSDTEPRYFVLDAASGGSAALRLPDPAIEPVMHQGYLGIIASPSGGGRYMVAELQPLVGSDHATLLCFSSDLGEWVEKEVHYPLPLAVIGTISHQGRLWWVDLSWGLITADHPVLGFVPLPEGAVLQSREAWGVTDKFRYVGVSDGFQLGPPTQGPLLRHLGRPVLRRHGPAKKVPMLALIHPNDPRIVYFTLHDRLFGVDVKARKVIHCETYNLVVPPSEYMANRFLRAWQLPRAISSGMANWWSNGMTLVNEETASPRRPSSGGGSRASRRKGMRITGLPGDYHLVGMSRQTFIG